MVIYQIIKTLLITGNIHFRKFGHQILEEIYELHGFLQRHCGNYICTDAYSSATCLLNDSL